MEVTKESKKKEKSEKESMNPKSRLGRGNDYMDISSTSVFKTELLDYEVDMDGVRLHNSPVPMQ